MVRLQYPIRLRHLCCQDVLSIDIFPWSFDIIYITIRCSMVRHAHPGQQDFDADVRVHIEDSFVTKRMGQAMTLLYE
jgi:hypothetical protein